MARVSRELNLIRTTLFVVSPALAAPRQARSRLYSADHRHLFRGGVPAEGRPADQPPAAASV
jgi:precorrin-4/cobalt-precorrin-4 C11-methyltransferase